MSPQGTVVSSMVFRQTQTRVLGTEPVTPDLEVKWKDDIENKAGWTPLEAVKDAFKDICGYSLLALEDWDREWDD